MDLRHVVVAVDQSSVGRHALAEAVALAIRTGSRLTAMTTLAARPIAAPAAAVTAAREARQHALQPALADLHARVRAAVPRESTLEVGTEVAYGVPGIEICHFAEDRGADLLVLGRKRRSQAERLLVGDTADAVARRSRVPCLFVPGDTSVTAPVLCAIDGGPRSARVVSTAQRFAAAAGLPFRLMTADPLTNGEPADLRELLAAERRERLHAIMRAAAPDAPEDTTEFLVRHGDVVSEVLAAAEGGGAGVLAVGYRRGGPPGVAELGSVARRLAHGAACPVLTVPL